MFLTENMGNVPMFIVYCGAFREEKGYKRRFGGFGDMTR